MKLTAIVFSITTVLACSVGADDTIHYRINPKWIDSIQNADGGLYGFDGFRMILDTTTQSVAVRIAIALPKSYFDFNWSPSTLLNNYDWKVEV